MLVNFLNYVLMQNLLLISFVALPWPLQQKAEITLDLIAPSTGFLEELPCY